MAREYSDVRSQPAECGHGRRDGSVAAHSEFWILNTACAKRSFARASKKTMRIISRCAMRWRNCPIMRHVSLRQPTLPSMRSSKWRMRWKWISTGGHGKWIMPRQYRRPAGGPLTASLCRYIPHDGRTDARKRGEDGGRGAP